jgi:SRSO17 transposase
LGKVENCQVGVFMAYGSPHGYALLDKRLFIPEKWFEEGYAERRKKCELSPAVGFKTKPQLAVEMFEGIQQKLPLKYVVSDTVYGRSPEFIDAVDRCIGVRYLVEVPSDTRCWLRKPMVIKKQYRYRGELHIRKSWMRVQRSRSVYRHSPRASMTSTGTAARSQRAPRVRSSMSSPRGGSFSPGRASRARKSGSSSDALSATTRNTPTTSAMPR